MAKDIIKNIPLTLDINAKKRIEGKVGISLYSKDIATGQFEFTFIDEDGDPVELDETYSAQTLVKYEDEEKTYLDDMIIEGNIIRFIFPHDFITKDGIVTMYIYITKDSYTSDVAAISFNVYRSEIDDVATDIVAAYDKNYEDILAEFKQTLEDYKSTLPKADSVRAEIDEVLNKFSEDSQAKLSQYDTDVQQVITDINEAETSRVEAEGQRESAETSRKANEADRDQAESERQTNETKRQTIFETNESERNGTFSTNETVRQENETTRQQAETQRASAESIRVSAEVQRKIDHANRSAEMDGKADRVIEPDDFITFQDFVGGRNLVLNTSDTDFRELTILNPTHLLPYNTGLKVEQGATYTVSMFVGDLSTNVAIEIGTGNQYGYLTNTQTSAIVLKPNQINTFVVTFYKIISEYGALYFRFRSGSADNTVVRFNKLKVTKGSTVYPYTKAPEDFSEITQRDIDKYISTVLPSASDLAMKVDKKQEDWITATLINGATGTAQYRKNEFGTVELTGAVAVSNTGLPPFILPSGYRPRVTFSIPVAMAGGNTIHRFTIGSSGSTFLNIGNTEIYLTGINFEAGG